MTAPIEARIEAPRTTIVVLQRECFSPTSERLDPILAAAGMSGGAPARVIFVDGGSPNPSREWLDAAAARLDMTVLRTPHCLAPSEGRALALPYVETEYVAFVDNDVQVSDGMHDAELRTGHDMYDLCLRVAAAGGECWVEPAAWTFYERPRHIAPEDRDLFALRWGITWDRLTLDRFAATWGLDTNDQHDAAARYWHDYHRRLGYVPADSIGARLRRKRRNLADSMVQAGAQHRDAEQRRRGGMSVAHAASWLEASPEPASTY